MFHVRFCGSTFKVVEVEEVEVEGVVVVVVVVAVEMGTFCSRNFDN